MHFAQSNIEALWLGLQSYPYLPVNKHPPCAVQVKFNVNRVDNMIIQAIALLDTLDKDINTFVMRVREWYSWHFPELVKLSADNYQYSQLALLVKDKSTLGDDKLKGSTLTRASPSKM